MLLCRKLCVGLQGAKTGTISFSDAEGVPVLADVNGKFMAVGTSTGIIKVRHTSLRHRVCCVLCAVCCVSMFAITVAVLSWVSHPCHGTPLPPSLSNLVCWPPQAVLHMC